VEQPFHAFSFLRYNNYSRATGTAKTVCWELIKLASSQLSPGIFSAGQANVEPAFLGTEEDLWRGLLRGGHDVGGEVFAPGESAPP